MSSVTDAMGTATRRRVPLVVLLCPSDSAARSELCSKLDTAALRRIAVVHEVAENSPEAAQLAAVSSSTTCPRCHVFAPASRQLPPLCLQGDELTCFGLRSAVQRALTLTSTELTSIIDGTPRAMLQSLVQRHGGQRPASAAAQAPGERAQPQSQKAEPAAKPAAAPAAEAPRPASAAASVEVNVIGGSSTETVRVPGVRGNTSMSMFRKLVAKQLGHDRFTVLGSGGGPLSSSEEERRIVSEICGADGRPSVKKTNAQLAIEAAQAAKAQETAVTSETERAAPLQRPPRVEDVKLSISTPEKTLQCSNQPAASADKVWAELSDAMGVPEAEIVVIGQHADDSKQTTITRGDSERTTFKQLAAFDALRAERVQRSEPQRAPQGPASSVVRVRLAYPGVKEQPTMDCQPTDALRVVHERAARDLNTEKFSLVQAYPPHRFTAAELDQSFEELQISRSVAIRVVSDPVQAAPAGDAAPAQGILAGAVSTVRGLFGARGDSAQAGDAPAAPPSSQGQPAERPRSMNLGDIARREAEERERRGGSNTYFGGDSTEYQGK